MTFSEAANLPATTSGTGLTFPRLDDDQMRALAVIADAPLPVLPPVAEEHLMQSMAVLDANLPRKASDDASGKLRVAMLKRKLGHMPQEQFDFMCNAVIDNEEWFPPIAVFLRYASQWQRADARERARARNLIERERQARLDDAIRRLKWADDVTQAEVDAWPEGWKRIAATQGLLYRDPEREFQIRPRAIEAPPESPEAPPTTEEPDV